MNSSAVHDESPEVRVLMVETVRVHLSSMNARKEGTEPDSELLDSIRSNGILVPVGVQEDGDEWACVWGHRRIRAAQILGLEHVPAVVVALNPERAKIANLVENYNRKPLRQWEVAEALLELHQLTGLEGKELGELVGMSPEFAQALLRIRRRLAPQIWNQFKLWGLTNKVRFVDLVELAGLPWDEQIERWNKAHDWIEGARRGCEYKPGKAKLRKMLARLESSPEVVREGIGFAAGAKYALRVAIGLEPWRHGGVVATKTRRARAKARRARIEREKDNGKED